MIERRSGGGSVAINGDLTRATLSIHALAWNKPSGNIADASATLLMSHDRLKKIDRIAVRGDGLLLTGAADIDDGHIRDLVLDNIRLGQSRAMERFILRRTDRSRWCCKGTRSICPPS